MNEYTKDHIFELRRKISINQYQTNQGSCLSRFFAFVGFLLKGKSKTLIKTLEENITMDII